jgi:acyl-CoA synthetase (AMP-forming)/AMP-acid ligase II
MTNLFNEISSISANKLAIIGEDRSFTYQELVSRINEISAHLLTQNVKQNDRIGLQNMHSYQFLIAYYACMKIGAIPVPIPFVDEERVSGAIDSANIRLVLDELDTIEARHNTN